MRRFLLITAMVQILAFFCCGRALAAPVATVIGLSGKVETASSGEDRWTAARVNQPLEWNDRIRTGSKSGVVLLFDGGSRLKLGPLTSMSISVRGSQPSGGVAIELSTGKVWAKVNKMNHSVFEIKTPVAHCGVRGTEFAMDVNDDGTTILTVVEGNTSFENEFGGVAVGASQQSTAEPGKAPTPPKVVDTRHWIEWTFDIRAMGTAFETPFHGGDKQNLEAIREQIEAEPRSERPCEDQIKLGQVLHDLGQLAEAGEAFSGCLDDEDFSLDAAYGLGKVKVAGGDAGAAAALFNGILESIANGEQGDDEETLALYSAKSFFGLGLASLKENKLETAKDFFGKSLEAAGSDFAGVGMAITLLNLGDVEGAMEFVETVLEANPDCYQAMTLKAILELAGNHPDAAMEAAAEAVKAAPWSPDAHAALARILFFRGEFDAARAAASETLALSPSNPAAHEILARLLLSKGEYTDAIREALLCLALDEDNPYANDDLAMIYYIYRKYDGAILHWKKAIAAEPGFSIAKIRLARLYNDLEEKETAAEAEKLAREVIGAEKENHEAYEELGRALEMLGKYAESEAAYMEALRIAPGNASHLARAASFYVARHKTDLAIFHAQKAVAAQPANPRNHFTLGRAYEAVDETAAAKAAYVNALYLDPDFTPARYQLGIILGAENNSWDALAEMHTAALEMPRVVTLAEYRGPSRVYGAAGSHGASYVEGVHTGDADAYKLNYRAVLTDYSTNGHREVNGDQEKTGGSLLAGYQQNADNSIVLYGDFSSDDKGVPGPATGTLRNNDPDDREKFKSGRQDISLRKRLGPELALTFRMKPGMTSKDDFFSDDIDLVTGRDETKDKNTELEFRAESRPDDNTKIVFGAFSNKSKFSEMNFYEDIFGPLQTSDDFFFRQKNIYLRAWHSPNPKLRLNAGIEKSKHNIAGAHTLSRFGFDYKLNERSWLRFISRDTFRLSFHPRYQPPDEWPLFGDMDNTAFGVKTRYRELNYETRLPDGTFIKASGYRGVSWQYDPASDFKKIGGVTGTRGITVDCEKPVSRQVSVFVAVASNTTSERTPGNAWYGYRVPYTDTSRASAGLYIFPNSSTTVKIIGDQNGKRYINAANTRELPAYRLVRLQIRYDPAIDRSYMFTVRNLFDKEYELEKGYPEDGRTYEFSLIRWF